MTIPKIEKVVSSPFESIELEGIVTVGEESAKRLSKVLGRKVEAGETFDLGTIAVYRKNRTRNFLDNLKLSRKKSVFS